MKANLDFVYSRNHSEGVDGLRAKIEWKEIMLMKSQRIWLGPQVKLVSPDDLEICEYRVFATWGIGVMLMPQLNEP